MSSTTVNQSQHRTASPAPVSRLLADISLRLERCFEPAAHPWPDESRAACGASLPMADLSQALAGVDLTPVLPPAMHGSVRRRQVAWIGGRLCAERALGLAGLPHHAVPRGDHGEPVWPSGIAGSITHTDAAAHALVTRRADGAGLGIDSEILVDGDAQRAVSLVCCTPSERAKWLDGPDAPLRSTLLFAAKEAVYKAAWPAVRRFIDFDEATVQDWDTSSATMGLRLSSALACATVIARYRLDTPRRAVHVCVSLDEALVASLKVAARRDALPDLS